MHAREAILGHNERNISEQFEKFCAAHKISLDQSYQELLATTLISHIDIALLERTLDGLCVYLLPGQMHRWIILKNKLYKSYLNRIFIRLMNMAEMNNYPLNQYFNLGIPTDKDVVPFGVRARDIVNLQRYETKSLRNLVSNYHKVPRETELLFAVPLRKMNLLSDAVETITGISNGAITAGDKITSGTVVYTKGASPISIASHSLFTYGSLALNAVDFILIPVGYIYRYATNKAIPFNRTHNLRWALAAIALALAIVSIAVPASALIISFITASLALATSGYTLGKIFYDDYKYNKERREISKKIDRTTSKIQLAQRNAAKIRKEINHQLLLGSPDPARIDVLKRQLEQVTRNYEYQCAKLKSYYKLRRTLKITAARQQSPIEKIDTVVRFGLAAIVIVGTILSLNPFTALFGVSMIAGAAIASFATFIGKRIFQVRRKKRERQMEMKLEHSIEVKKNSTSKLLATLRSENELNAVNDISHQATTIEEKLITFIDAENKPGVLEYFVTLEKTFIRLELDEEDVDSIFDEIDDDVVENAFQLLKEVLNDINQGKLYLHDQLKAHLEDVELLASQFDKFDVTVEFEEQIYLLRPKISPESFLEEDAAVSLNRHMQTAR